MKALRKLAATLGVSADYLETGSELDADGARELRLNDAQLALRFGDAESAEQQLRQLYEDALKASDRGVAARALIALALAADDRGEHAAAVSQFEQAFELERPSPLERMDVFATLGRAYGALGHTAREIALDQECLYELEDRVPPTLTGETLEACGVKSSRRSSREAPGKSARSRPVTTSSSSAAGRRRREPPLAVGT